MSTKKIKKGDNVIIIAGKDKDKEGKVLSINDNKVIVEGVNMIKKHTKPSQEHTNGGIIEREAAIDVSNVMFIHKGKPTRVGFKSVEGKKGLKKVRFAKSTGDIID
ncbi:MAG TPA: 50S ribosomal protein L24 [Clostridiales bacterium]|nr:50S ribosomal protein L24 [Clostridiales bacterium]